jgi:hypothetical protein
LLKEKVELAASIMESNLLPTDWIYENIFHLSEDQYDEYRDLIREDSKRKFRLTQIESEGNDPIETGQSYGTPHDLATLYGKGRMYTEPENIPVGYKEDEKLGRPEEKASNRNTQDSAFGKDRIGSLGNKKDNDSSDSIKPNYKGGSPLALEGKPLSPIQSDMLKQIPISKKRLVFEADKQKESLLDENQIRE